jgi:hypothetical protein
VLLVAAVLELLRVHAELAEQTGVLLWVYLLHALHLLGWLLVVAAELSDQIQDLADGKSHGDSFCGTRMDGVVPAGAGPTPPRSAAELPTLGKRHRHRRDCGAGAARAAQPPPPSRQPRTVVLSHSPAPNTYCR